MRQIDPQISELLFVIQIIYFMPAAAWNSIQNKTGITLLTKHLVQTGIKSLIHSDMHLTFQHI